MRNIGLVDEWCGCSRVMDDVMAHIADWAKVTCDAEVSSTTLLGVQCAVESIIDKFHAEQR